MAQRKPDRPLRKTLAQLHRMRADDRAAILELLDPGSRLRVARLLEGAAAQAPADSLPSSASFAEAGYSPWLLARLEVPQAGKGPMTTAASEMLRECAERHRSAQPALGAPGAAKAKRRPGLFRIGSQAK